LGTHSVPYPQRITLFTNGARSAGNLALEQTFGEALADLCRGRPLLPAAQPGGELPKRKPPSAPSRF